MKIKLITNSGETRVCIDLGNKKSAKPTYAKWKKFMQQLRDEYNHWRKFHSNDV